MLGDREALTRAHRDMRNAAVASGSPALMLLSDRAAELRAATRSSPRPPANDQGTFQADGHADTEQMSELRVEATATAHFLRGFESAPKRCHYALQMLARCTSSHEAYLFSNVDDTLSSVMGLGENEPLDELKGKVSELLRRRATSGITAELMRYNQVSCGDPTRRFRVILLPVSGNDPHEKIWAGAVALSETADSDVELPAHLIADLGQILSDALSKQISIRAHAQQ